MQIDWTTLVLEIINFLALVWILKRFLYKPVVEILAARQARVESKLSEARAIEAGAKNLQTQYERRLADWEMEKAKAQVLLENDLANERNRQMQALAKALAEERERVAAVAAHKQQELRHELELEAMANARQFTTTLLARLANPAIEARFVDLLLENWASLPDSQFDGLRTAAMENSTGVVITTAFPLSEEQRQRIKSAMENRLNVALAMNFNEDSSLLSGIRLSLGPWQLSLNFADEMAGFKAASNHVL
jgi:F-type H+-transporting ATPase subunit b